MPGRCSGCGKTGTSRAVRSHVMECESYAALTVNSPASALDPEAEYARWVAEGKPAERTARIEASVARNTHRRAAQAGRFAHPPDILAEPGE